jgi:hypothetical protein
MPLLMNVINDTRAEIIPTKVLLKPNPYLARSGIVVINMLLDALIAMVNGSITDTACSNPV